MLMFEIVDVLAIKSLERKLGRPLDELEMASIKEYGSLIVEINGVLEEYFIDRLDLNDLMPLQINVDSLVEQDRIKQERLKRKETLAQPKVSKNKRHQIEETNQYFILKPGVETYFNKIREISNDETLSEVDRAILFLHAEGLTARAVSECLSSQFDKRGLKKSNVSRRLNEILKTHNLTPLFTKRKEAAV